MKKAKESYTKNNIEQLFVPITIAKLAKKYGFDEDCFGYYESQSKELIIYYANKSEQVKKDTRNIYDVSNINSKLPQWAISAPTHEQLRNWFENKFNIQIIVCRDYLNSDGSLYKYETDCCSTTEKYTVGYTDNGFKTYYKAYLEGFKACFIHVKAIVTQKINTKENNESKKWKQKR